MIKPIKKKKSQNEPNVFISDIQRLEIPTIATKV